MDTLFQAFFGAAWRGMAIQFFRFETWRHAWKSSP